MNNFIMKTCFLFVMVMTIVSTNSSIASAQETKSPNIKSNPIIKMEIEYLNTPEDTKDIIIELYQQKAPITVSNFLSYVKDGYYNETIFHRVIAGFMIQGGGFKTGLIPKKTLAPIKNEAPNGLSNTRGTIAMARSQRIDSATSQFFINAVDNGFLDHKGKAPETYGYAVFGKVISGMDVVDEIETKKSSFGLYKDVPIEDIMIKSVEVISESTDLTN